MTQEERLQYLVEAFQAEAEPYKHIQPGGREDRQRLLRALMNLRAPAPLDEAVLAVQDAYLRARAAEKGIVSLGDIPALREQYGFCGDFAETRSLWQGDITRLEVDAIVNAANNRMLGCFRPLHSCIDNCIHTFAGVQLRAECDRQMRQLRRRYGADYVQPTAVPLLTDAYALPAKKILHVVGPIVSGPLTRALERDLADCYKNVLEMCLEHGLSSVAFCCISTGVYAFPGRRAAEIALETVTAWLRDHADAMERVIFNVFGDRDRQCYEALLGVRL